MGTTHILVSVFPVLLLLIVAGQTVGAFNVCRSVNACVPGSECCGRNCVPLMRSVCKSCSSPPCRCQNGFCKSATHGPATQMGRSLPGDIAYQQTGSGDSRIEVRESVKWPDILLIASFAVIIAVSLASGLLWAYLTLRDAKKLQQDESVRKEERKRTTSQGSLRVIAPPKRVSSKSSKELVKA